MTDLVAEANVFFNETREEGEFDLQSPLVWGYVLGPLRPEQVEPMVAAIHQRGFADVTPSAPECGEPPRIRIAERRTHTAESFAERIKILSELAAQHGCELLDWTLDSDEESAVAAQAVPSGCLTRQEIGQFACKCFALWLLVQGATTGVYGLLGAICAAFLPHRNSILEAIGVAMIMLVLVPGAQLIVGVLLWRGSGAIGRLMIRNDPTPLQHFRLDVRQLMILACMATGVFVFADEVRALFSLAAWLANLPLDLRPAQIWSNAHWTQNFWPAIFGLALAVWLILGSRGIVRFVERLRSVPEPLPDEDKPVQESPAKPAK